MNEAQQVLEQAKQVAEKLGEQGPRQAGSFKMALFQKQMKQALPRGRAGKRRKAKQLRRAHKNATPAQRRAFTKEQERRAHRRFEVAVGLRPNTAPPPVKTEAQKDVEAMIRPAQEGRDGTVS
jgi:hypothetical protein